MKNYSYCDLNTTGSTVYYRLIQTDLDGKFSYSKTIAVHSNIKNEVSVHPNPTTNEVHFTGLKSGSSATFYNLEGKDVFAQKIIENVLQIPLDLKSGLYILRVKETDGKINTFKISVSR